jgi:hypothetical protein
LPTPDPGEAQQALARRWLARFGPATAEDLQWWTGWNKTTTHRALSHLPVTEIDLHGRPGIILTELDDEPGDASPPVASLLPALDPTPMGWKHRDWFLGHPHPSRTVDHPRPRVQIVAPAKTMRFLSRQEHSVGLCSAQMTTTTPGAACNEA